MDLELKLWRSLCMRLPALPHATGVVNRIVKPVYLRKPRQPLVCSAWGVQMKLDPAEAIDGMILFCPQLFNRKEFRWLRTHLRPTDVFVDVGAHIGAYSLYASRLARQVIAIEANPNTFMTLQENIRLNNASVTAIHCGASDKCEKLRLHLQGRANRGGSSFLIEHHCGDVEIECKPLRDLAPNADAVKLDVELMEHRVLSPYLQHHKPRMIILEKHGARDAVELCLSSGYKIVDTTAENALLMS